MGSIETACGLLDEIEELAGEEANVSLGDVVDKIGPRGVGPLIFVPAIVIVSPIGAIPGVPSIFAVVIALVVIQYLVGRDGVWLPKPVRDRNIDAGRVNRSVTKARPWAERMDRWFGHRLSWLVQRPAKLSGAVTVLGLCVLVPPLELIPFAAMVPMLAAAIIGLAFTARDGVLMLVGFCLSAAALIMAFNMLISG